MKFSSDFLVLQLNCVGYQPKSFVYLTAGLTLSNGIKKCANIFFGVPLPNTDWKQKNKSSLYIVHWKEVIIFKVVYKWQKPSSGNTHLEKMLN